MDIILSFLIQWGKILWAVSWQVSILFFFILLISIISRKSSSNFRYWLWCIILLRLCIPAELHLPIGIGNDLRRVVLSLPSVFTELSPEENLSGSPGRVPPDFSELLMKEFTAGNLNMTMLSELSSSYSKMSFSIIALVIWFLLTGIMALVIFLRVLRVSFLLKKCQVIEQPELTEVFTRLCRTFRIKRNVELCYLDSNRINSPLVIGYLKPKVFLPRRITETWKTKDIEPVLTHELAHIKRHDILINWLQIIMQLVFFFHPVVWFANWKIRQLREDACDDLAIEQTKTSRKRYVEKMLRIIKESEHEPAFTFQVTGFIETRSSLAKRIIRILSTKYRAYPRLTTVSVLSLIFVAIVSITLASGRTVNKDKIIEINTPIAFGKKHNINFIEDKTLEEIGNILQKENKAGLLYFSSKNVEWCTKLEEEVFSIDSISSYIETNFISFNFTSYKSYRELWKDFKLQGIPSVVIINESSEEISRIYGYMPAEEYFKYLKKAFEDGKNTMQLKAAYEANPDDIYVAYLYGARLFNYGDYEKALPIWENLNTKTFEKEYQNIWKFLHLGSCYERTKQRDKAIEVYKRALEPGGITNANHRVDTCDRLVRLYETKKQYDLVIKYLDILSEIIPELENKSWIFRARYNLMKLPFAYAFTGQEEKGRELIDNIVISDNDTTSASNASLFCGNCVYYKKYIKEGYELAKKPLEIFGYNLRRIFKNALS